MNLSQGINLRPWREEARLANQKNFQLFSLIAVALGVCLSILIWQTNFKAMQAIEQGNQLIQQHSKQLNTEIHQVISLRKRHTELFQHLEAMQQLQANRLTNVQVLEHFAKSVNTGIHLLKLKRTNNLIEVQGLAYPAQATATFMHELNLQPLFLEPVLNSLTTDPKTGQSQFELTLPLQGGQQ